MKNILAAFASVAIFASCTNTPNNGVATQQPQQQAITPDTSGFAQFQEWKKQQEMMEWNRTYQGVQDDAQAFEEPAAVAAPRVQTRERVVYRDRQPARRTAARSTARSSSRGSSGSNGTVASTGQQAPARKKGWSKAAQGAAIGGASGAVVGAIVSKKKGKGAIIGGIIGAGGGYVLGRAKDKRDGRY